MNNQALIEKCLNGVIKKITNDSGRYFDPSLKLATNTMRLVKEVKRLFNNEVELVKFAFKGVVPASLKPSLSQTLKAAWVAIKKIASYKVNHFERRASYLNWYYETIIDNAAYNIMRAAEQVKADNASNSPPTKEQFNDNIIFASKVEAFRNQRYGTNE